MNTPPGLTRRPETTGAPSPGGNVPNKDTAPLFRQSLGRILLASFAIALFVQLVFSASIRASLGEAWFGAALALRSAPQATWWAVAVLAAAALGALRIVREMPLPRRTRHKTSPVRGPVESLAWEMSQSRRKRYFQWVVANRLARLAHTLLLRRTAEGFLPSRELSGTGWNPPQAVQRYLEAGLQTSLESAPTPPSNPLAPRPPDPLALDVEEAIAYIEKQEEFTN